MMQTPDRGTNPEQESAIETITRPRQAYQSAFELFRNFHFKYEDVAGITQLAGSHSKTATATNKRGPQDYPTTIFIEIVITDHIGRLQRLPPGLSETLRTSTTTSGSKGLSAGTSQDDVTDDRRREFRYLICC
ncbi:hypothetical protein [Schlesneria sp. DSM 10557]|uniref:hypothetical protein n=1 Tax=Schlesneria sp. DSM 10557 TaxID=3044399 RepID=UPI0035A0B6A2